MECKLVLRAGALIKKKQNHRVFDERKKKRVKWKDEMRRLSSLMKGCACLCQKERGREREKERGRDRERGRERVRKRQRETERDRETERQRDRGRESERGRERQHT